MDATARLALVALIGKRCPALRANPVEAFGDLNVIGLAQALARAVHGEEIVFILTLDVHIPVLKRTEAHDVEHIETALVFARDLPCHRGLLRGTTGQA